MPFYLWMLILPWAAVAFAQPAVVTVCQDDLRASPQTESSILPDALLDRFEVAYGSVDGEVTRLSGLETRFIKLHQLDGLYRHVSEIRAQIDEAFTLWTDSTPTVLAATSGRLDQVLRKLEKLRRETQLWLKRAGRPGWNEAREDRRLLMQHRIYDIETLRGERIRVRFGRDLVRDFFWNTQDATMAEAADHALIALQRGFRPDTSRGASGIGFLPERRGIKVVKLHFSGQSFGAYRVYGILEGGVLSLVTFEHSSKHDARYLTRAADRTIDAFKNEVWN